VPVVTVALRTGLRLEQVVAYLETLDLKMSLEQFYQLAEHPPASLIAAYPFLSTLPAGRSLEGFLGPGTFQVYQDITPRSCCASSLTSGRRRSGWARSRRRRRPARTSTRC